MKKLTILLLLLFASQSPNFAQNGWFWQNPKPQGNRLNDVYFLTLHDGWAVGDFGTILHSNDVGYTWETQLSPNNEILNSVYFRFDGTDMIGWAVGYGGTILHTANGGDTWTEQNSGVAEALFDVYFVSSLKGWIVGQGETVLRTTDGGNTWDEIGYTGPNHYFSLYFHDENTGWLAGVAGFNAIIKHTTNGGDSWTTQTIPASRMNSIHFADENTGYAAGDGGKLFHTNNGGSSWSIIESNTTADLNSVHMINPNQAWAVGDDGVIIHTNVNDEWFFQFSDVTAKLHSVQMLDGSVGWIVGDGGAILHTNNGGGDWWTICGEINDWLEAAEFPNSTHGWIAGKNGLVLRTTDGGNTWDRKVTNTSMNLYDIHTYSSNLALVVGDVGLVLFTNDGGDTWYNRSYSLTTNRLYSVHKRRNGKVWAAGEFGFIMYTTDNGHNWEVQHQSNNYHLYSIYFSRATRGWACGMSGAILRTTDGGENWVDVSPNNLDFFNSIFFIDTRNGWVCGQQGKIYKSTDGGVSWIPIEHGLTYESLMEINFVSPLVGWAAGFHGTILFSFDGGDTWIKQKTGTDNDFRDIDFSEPGIGWAVGLEGTIMHTDDGGGFSLHDSYYRTGLMLTISDFMHTTDELEVVLPGDFMQTHSLVGLTVVIDSLVHSSDSDLTFTLSHAGISDTLIHQAGADGDNFIGTNLSDAAGDRIDEGEAPFEGFFKPHSPLSVYSGSDPNGTWTLDIYDGAADNTGMLHSWGLRLFFDMATGTEQEEISTPTDFSLSHNYPNPFNPSTAIKYTIASAYPRSSENLTAPTGRDGGAGVVLLKVYDLIGKEISVLVNEEQLPGSYEVEFDGNRLSSGVYFYRLQVLNEGKEIYSETKKMLLLK